MSSPRVSNEAILASCECLLALSVDRIARYYRLYECVVDGAVTHRKTGVRLTVNQPAMQLLIKDRSQARPMIKREML